MSTLDILIPLFTQLSLLVSCAVLLSLLRMWLKSWHASIRAVIIGCFLGFFAILLMHSSVRVVDDVIFDLRFIIFALAVAIGGVLPAALVSLLVIAYCLVVGGMGAPLAIGVVLTSTAFGIGLHFYLLRPAAKFNLWLAGLGLIVALQSLAWSLLLSVDISLQTIDAMIVPILIAFPFGSWLLGSLMLSLQRQLKLEAILPNDHIPVRSLLDGLPDHGFVQDSVSRYAIKGLNPNLSAGKVPPGNRSAKTASDPNALDVISFQTADEQARLRRERALAQARDAMNEPSSPVRVPAVEVPLQQAQEQIVEPVDTRESMVLEKQAEEALQRERNLLRTLIDTVPASVYIKDAQSRFIDANSETVQKMGAKSVADLIGKTDFDFFPPTLAARYFADDQAIIQSGLPKHNIEEPTLDQRTQQELWLLTTKAPIRDDHGEVTGLVGVGLDITERKRAETQTFALSAERQRVKLLREFMSDVSHDFRTPLSIIATSAYLVGTTTESAKLAQYRQRIETQLSRLTALLDSFVELGELEQGALAVQSQSTDLAAVVSGVVERSKPDAAAKNQKLEYQCEASSLRVLGEAGALGKAITKVVENAICYTPDEGQIILHLFSEGENAVVEVTDTGIGIPESDLPHIFESFYRVDAARSLKSGGAGLGLSIAKKILELINGRIEAQSKLGRGSVFTIYVPLDQASD